jgi:CRISPR-associated endonuclease/helicase Cas3
MMVTFISQCEKKSLNKTRRVLDTFANRIGNNTWQTVITEQGLNAVQKLLNKTATKNTAVSCHWIRSRSRSDVLWIIGKKNKFNNQGIVPVNYTNQLNALKMDNITVNIENFYANTKKQPLTEHLFAVGFVAYLLCKKITNNDMLSKAVFTAGCWHDMGKIDPAFQLWLTNKTKKKIINEIPEDGQHIDKSGQFSFEKHPRHNEISLLLYFLLDDENDKSINKANKNLIKHCIYWHHAKPVRKEDFKKLDGINQKITPTEVTKIIPITHEIIKNLNNLMKNYSSDLTITKHVKHPSEDKLFDVTHEHLPKFKSYGENEQISSFKKDIEINAKNNIARTVIITADRLVSSLTREELQHHIEHKSLNTLLKDALSIGRGLKHDIQTCLNNFDKKYPDSARNKQQSKAVKELSDKDLNISVLQGPAGCGKTKIALEWAAENHAKKIIWICPRIQICQGLVNDLKDDEYLPNTKIEICTGEFKNLYQNGIEKPTPENEEFSGEIILTTIDQVINTITTHTKITGLMQYMNAHVVFDEFHEYIPMAGFNLLFAELVSCKSIQEKSNNTLLISATPNYFFLQELLNLDKEDITNIESFNKSQYKIEFQNFDETLENESNPLHQPQEKTTFVISNTALTAQKSFITNQNTQNEILIHSKFTQTDRKDLFNEVFNSFKESGNKKFDVLRAGPIVQASLNITCSKMITEFTNAENWLQRMGRLDRFSKNTSPNLYISAISDNVKNGKCLGNGRFLNSLFCLQSTKAWFDFLKNKLPENDTVTISKIYQIYLDFYQDENCINAITQDLISALKYSVQQIELKVIDPISFPSKKKTKNDTLRIKNNSLRGDNRFAQMAIRNINNGNEEFPNKYACEGEFLTISVQLIKGYGDSERDLLSVMAKKHHNINSKQQYGVTKITRYKERIYLKKAKEPETPIFLSYTPEDLKQVEAQQNNYAVYYAIGKNQPIGAISADQINSQGVQ